MNQQAIRNKKTFNFNVTYIYWSIIGLALIFLLYLVGEHLYFGYYIREHYVIPKKQISNEEFIQYVLNKNLFHYLSLFAPVILAIFSAIFGLFTYQTNQNLKKSEDLLTQFNATKKDFSDKVDSLAADLEKKIISIQNSAIDRKDLYRQLMFLFNKYIPKNKTLEIEEISRMLEIMEPKFIPGACYYLGENGSKNCVEFLKDYKLIYDSDEHTRHLSHYIENAITKIESR